jgi:acyl carrier protein
MATIEQLTEIISETGFVDDMASFDPNASFSDNGIDSLDVMTVLLKIEESTGVEFSDKEYDAFVSLSDVLNIINSH